MKLSVAYMLVASATAFFPTQSYTGDFGTNPYLLGTMLDGKLKPKQQIPLVMAVSGSKSPALPFLMTGDLNDNELEFAHYSQMFTGYEGSTGVTQRILPFLAGDYADQPENTLPLMMLASQNPVGFNTGDVVDLLVEDKEFINEKDYYLFDQLMGGKPLYTENPFLAKDMFKRRKEDRFLTSKDFADRAMINQAGRPGNFYIMQELRHGHKINGAKEFITGDDFSYTRDLARGANDGLVYDYLDEDDDEITGKQLRMIESLKPAEEFNPFIFTVLKKDEVMQNKDLLKINLASPERLDASDLLDLKHLGDRRNRDTTPSNFFRYTGVTGKDAGKFHRDSLPKGNVLNMEQYIKYAELKGEDVNPYVSEAFFDSEDELNEKNLYLLNIANGKEATDPVEAFEAFDDTAQFDKLDLKVYEAMQGSLPAKEGLMWDVIDDDGYITETDLVTLTELSGVEVPFYVEEMFDDSFDEVTNEDMMRIQALTGDGTINPLLLSKSQKKEKPLTPEDFIAFSGVKPGVRPGDQGGYLEDMLKEGILEYDDLKLPLLVGQSSQGRPGTFNDFIPASMSIKPKVNINKDVYPWAMVSGNYDPYFVNPNVESDSLIRWTTGGRFNAPEPKPLPEPEPEVYYIVEERPITTVPRTTVAPSRPYYPQPRAYNYRKSSSLYRGNPMYPSRVGTYGYPLRSVGN